jgi:hypothetical protein
MKHTLQQFPVEPIGQAAIASAREKAVARPSSSARINISRAAGSRERSSGVRIFFREGFSSAMGFSLGSGL